MSGKLYYKIPQSFEKSNTGSLILSSAYTNAIFSSSVNSYQCKCENKSAKMGNEIFCANSGFPVKKVAANSDQRNIPLGSAIFFSSSIWVRKMIFVKYLKLYIWKKKFWVL